MCVVILFSLELPKYLKLDVYRILQGCLIGVSRVFQGSFKGVSRMFQGCFKGACLRGWSRVCNTFLGCFEEVPGHFMTVLLKF